MRLDEDRLEAFERDGFLVLPAPFADDCLLARIPA